VREALLSAWQGELEGARLLDLFAGSGAVGLEGLGRGAARLVGLESEAGALRQLGATYQRWSGGRAEARRADLPEDLSCRVADQGPFDLVFADPPYDFDRFEELLAACDRVLAPGGEVAVEHSSRSTLPARVASLVAIRSRRYGESRLTFYRRRAGALRTAEGEDG
jgi:16S rRNA (guanine966-N2)-methyltransferase